MLLKDKNIKITFEDKGQDYTTWIISPAGKVIDAQPFCSLQLSEVDVLDTKFIKGMNILYMHQEQKKFLPFKVTKVEEQ